MTTTQTPDAVALVLPSDDELRADLATVGVELHTGEDEIGLPVTVAVVPHEAAQVDAMASALLRRMAEIDRDTAQHHAAYDLEVQMLTARFARRLGPLQAQRAMLEAFARHLAKVQADSGGFGKKRSRDVGYGTYGVRAIPSKIEVADQAAFVAWAETNAPDLLRVTVPLSLAEAREYLSKTEVQRLKREVLVTTVRAYVELSVDPENPRAPTELPPGVRRTEEGIETWAKPEPLR